MKNYAVLLNDDDLGFVCRVISGKQLREIYKKNTKEFQKIKPGFRPGNLSDEDTYAFAIRNKDTSFVNAFLNVWIQERLDEISEHKEGLLNAGKTKETAFVEALALSVFSENISVYFSLLGDQLSKGYIALINFAMGVANTSKEVAPSSDASRTADKDNVQQMTALQAKHEDELNALKVANSEVQESLVRAESDLAKSKEEQLALQTELAEYRELSKHAAIEENIEPTDGYDYLSLCKVYTDDSGKTRLLRLADIRNGEISEALSDDAPKYTHLYRKDGPSTNDFIGVWDWKVIPSANDPTKDYIQTAFNSSILPIEVLIANDCQSIADLVSSIKAGISTNVVPTRMIYAFYNGSTYEGLYCDVNTTLSQSGKLGLQPGILKLPVFVFHRSAILFNDNGAILRSINLGIPTKVARIKNPLDIVKELIVSRVTWPVMHQQGYIRNEYRQIKDFLSALPTAELYEELSTACDCNVDEAKQYINDFFTCADSYVSGTTLENSIMAQIIKNDENMFQVCMEELRVEWEQKNQALLEEAQRALASVKAEENNYRKAADQKQEEYHMLEVQIAESQEKIEAQERLALEVEDRVLAKIEQARSNAAEFIAENAFVHLDSPAPAVVVPASPVEYAGPVLFHDGRVKDANNLEINNNWHELLSTLQAELREAGVGESSVIGLSALLYSAFINRTPVLLTGPNGRDIATAFSLAVHRRTPAVLQCIGDLVPRAVKQCEESETETVVIEQPFQHEWYNSIILLLERRQKFYIAVHPFAEDLVIEPRGLMNYCIPVLTELFIEGLPTMNYLGGHMADNFKPFASKEASKHYNKLLKALGINSLAKLNVQRTVSDMHEMMQSNQTDCDYLFLLYPLAYAVGEIAELKEYIDNATVESKPSAKVEELLKQYMGEDE